MVEPAPSASTAALRFSKMHGAGNDFVLIDLRDGVPAPDAALCRALADRHAGVGCDQILTVERARSAGAVASYRIWNADGTASQQCGNGARCIAAWLVRDALQAGDALAAEFVLDSPVGRHRVSALEDGRYRVEMGAPQFDPASIPLRGFAQAEPGYPIDLATLQSGAGKVVVGAVSMGNPHALLDVDDVATAAVAEIGALLQRHAAFPESVNVGFAQIVSRDRVRLRVYERGVGETLACGSGACAAASILIRRGQVDRKLSVELPGGALEISWPSDDAPVAMAGPAAFVFEGEWLQ